MPEIDGVTVNEIEVHSSALGYVKQLDGFENSAVVMSYRDTIRAYYYDQNRNSNLVCVGGMIQAVLFDKRLDSSTRGEKQVVTMGDAKSVSLMIPAGVAFGYKAIGPNPSLVVCGMEDGVNWNDDTKIPVNDVEIDHDWKVQVC